MELGIFSDNLYDCNFNSSYLHNSDEAIVLEVNLPSEVERSLKLSRNFMSKTGIPLVNLSQQGHGNDYGFVFRFGNKNYVNFFEEDTCFKTDFTKNILGVRISYGMPLISDSHLVKKSIKYKDSSKIKRLHLSIYGARNFLPKDKSEKSESNHFGYVSESIHFSMRWLDGKFDNKWNNPESWLSKDKSQKSYSRFNEKRTTYYETLNNEEGIDGAISDGRISLENALEIISPRRDKVLKSLNVKEFLSFFPKDTSLEQIEDVMLMRHFRRKNSFPSIGYRPVLDILSKFGECSVQDSAEMEKIGVEEGIEYMFGKILPAMKRFTQS